MEELIEIRSIQFKRGKKATLITKLKGDNKPKAGEPIFEIDTNRLKIGDGIHDYEDLKYTVDIDEVNQIYNNVQAEARTVAGLANQVSADAYNANNAKIAAEMFAREAQTANSNAQKVKNELPELVKTAGDAWVQQTFWHGSWEKYNELTEINPDTIYIIEY